MSATPLQGLRVLELGNLLAAPCAGMRTRNRAP